MSLFQNTVTKKYLLSQDERIKSAYKLFTDYFLNAEIQENILSSKEEQFQEGFLRELFVRILGYTLNPDPNFNLITERKNEKDSKKADGAILIRGEVVGIIELKDHKTIDLKQVETQAFGYKNNNRKASYVVTSNFEKLRFYIDNAIDFAEFNLFTLTYDEFALLWLCLAHENIAKDLPKQMKSESVNSENDITKKLYKDYSEFKRALFADLVANNPAYDQLTLFKKSQKLLDRLLFILFAEDSGLLPANSLTQIVEQWETLKDLDAYSPLYDRMKMYFGYMNTGHKGKKHDIFAYNGGLFKADEVLDNVIISDEVLREYAIRISQYNFASEVDVNILGHIFENSLTEIEEITNSITAGEATPQISKRKKDGVFYTPRYITTYIVENTLGKLCADKKAELEIVESEYFADKKRQTATKKRLDDKLKAYREWLLQLTICDPACGSGAFLNAALDYLMGEHRLIDEMFAKLYNVPMVLPDIENSILENNLFGVDINEESVEIAKLALWLRTAKPHRKLNSLNDNIKCGNSLISDPEVAGDKAFDWHREFPQVFAKGGFDVVIGNPPYVQLSKLSSTTIGEKDYLFNTYKVAGGRYNTFIFFLHLGYKILSDNGLLSFIIPNTILTQEYYKDTRKFILDNTFLYEIANYKEMPFADAVVESVTLFYAKEIKNNYTINITEQTPKEIVNIISKNKDDFYKSSFYSFSFTSVAFIDALYSKSKPLSYYCDINQAIALKGDKSLSVKRQNKDNTYYKLLDGRNINKYSIDWDGAYLDYSIDRIHSCKRQDIFEVSEKLFFRRVSANLIFTYDNNQFYALNTLIVVLPNHGCRVPIKYFLALLNSKLINYIYSTKYKSTKKVFSEIQARTVGMLPIILPTNFDDFICLADKMLTLNAKHQTLRSKFLRRLQDNFEDIKITGALERFDTLDFAGFVKELAKQKIKLSLKQQDEWEEYFNDYRTQCAALSAEITATDQTIDKMVYELYGLTEEEIQIIEKN